MPRPHADQAKLHQLWRVAATAVHLADALPVLASILGVRSDAIALLELQVSERTLRRIDQNAPASHASTPSTALAPSAFDALSRWFTRGESTRVLLEAPASEVAPLAFALDWPSTTNATLIPIGNPVTTPERAVAIAESMSRELVDLLREICSTIDLRERERNELQRLRNAAESERDGRRQRLARTPISDEIIGAATGLRQVLERIELAARADVPVLILGETGAGKEVLARAVHERSERHERPFIRVNCGAIPPDLIDSELFGHDRGAFTGATDMRRGWFEQAHGGTLFLDEIGELPLPAQVRLLRVLQDGTLQRVGGHTPIRVDVRIVAATHRDLPSLVQRREFREDLWYRIAVFPVLLPPLRDRPEDIAPLAIHFARRAARRFGLPSAPLTPQDVERLSSYAWPGNVRELASVIDRAVILGRGERLEIAIALGGDANHRPSRPIVASEALDESIESLDSAVRQHIERALRRTQGRIEGARGAAALLDINPHTLRARMRKLGLRWADFRR